MKRKGFLFGLIIIVTGCHSSPKDIFPQKKDVAGTVLIKSKDLYDPWDIVLKDSLLIVGNFKGRPLLQIFNLNGKLLAGRFSKPGFNNILTGISSMQTSDIKDILYVDDARKNILYSFSLQKLLKDSTAEPTVLFKDSAKNTQKVFERVFKTQNSFVGTSRSTSGRLVTLTQNGKTIKFYVRYPAKIDATFNSQQNAELYSSGVAVSPNGKKLGLATFTCDILNTFDITKDALRPLWSTTQRLPNDVKLVNWDNSPQIFFSDKSIMGYLDVEATNNFFYTIYSGKTSADSDSFYSSIIRRVSWDGKQRTEFHCDKLLKRLVISPDDKYIYAVSEDDKKRSPQIIKVKIN